MVPGDAVEEGEAALVAGAVEPVRHQPDVAGEGIVEGGEGGGEVILRRLIHRSSPRKRGPSFFISNVREGNSGFPLARE